MPNTLGNYNEVFFANEALIQLEYALGLATRVYREYNQNPQVVGDTIQIRKPGSFTAQDAPSTAQDLKTGSTSLVLNRHKEVKFELTDREMTLSRNSVIEEHIRPAAYALALEIDATLAALFLQVPWYVQQAAAAFDISDVANVRKTMFNNGVPMDAGRLSMMVDGNMEANLLSFLAGKNITGAGADAARTSATLGTLMGFDVFANQNTPSFTTNQLADNVGVAGATAVGASSIAISGLTASQVNGIKAGDILTIAGQTQQYAVTATTSTDASGNATVAITPTLAVATAGTEAVTIVKITGTKTLNGALHRNAFALGMANLSEMGGQLGARIARVGDPKTGLALRSRMYYDGALGKVGVALDVLYGVKVLDPNLATRFYSY